ncbi:hypothetical protein Nepgr_028239 [Nepenthes gracilis]|uniref:RING-CH-type domain-containing protein n=1 Tax=Nepenthes gracilis TaxID=150966 RepID=A0AAD3TC29_NEPGR|nr:hypothetical protein Nepgr_028239 [Nepenthes gracilis]
MGAEGGVGGAEDEQNSSESQQARRRENQQVRVPTEITEEIPPGEYRRPQNLVLEIPSRTLENPLEDCMRISMPPMPSPTPKRVNFSPMPSPSIAKMNMSPSPSSSKEKSPFKRLLPKLSFKFRSPTSEIEKAAMLALGSSSLGTRERSSISRTLSFTKLFTPKKFDRTSSLPDKWVSHSNPESTHGGYKRSIQVPIHRSRSVPVLDQHGKQIDLNGGVFRVIPTTPQAKEGMCSASSANAITAADESKDDGENIPEEEAVCRICFIELGEGSDTLKMECSCKGELALAHQECAVKWFSIKGNKICDVCKQEVSNLPVTLLRIQNPEARGTLGNRAQADFASYRVWQDVPVLVIVSMLAYFCFLEQLLVSKMGSGAIAISLPFSCILGLLASMTATTIVRRGCVWIYATIQFTMVVLFAHIFYSLLQVQAILSVLVATFVGFAITMCGNSIVTELYRWQMWQRAHSNQQQRAAARHPNQSPEPGAMARQSPSHQEVGGPSDVHDASFPPGS